MNGPRKEHWDKIYSTKSPHEVSWTQDDPATSLTYIHSLNLSRDASIIDIGGGESKLVDRLLEEGFEDVTVLDISEEAIGHTKHRLGEGAARVTWVVSDVLEFETDKKYDVWHDRATFHFLTTSEEIEKYVAKAKQFVKDDGFLIIGTFSENGPPKCSGLKVRRYSDVTLEDQLGKGFEKVRCLTEDHRTPFNTVQNFLFCSFKRIK